jgi:hypothetical protein
MNEAMPSGDSDAAGDVALHQFFDETGVHVGSAVREEIDRCPEAVWRLGQGTGEVLRRQGRGSNPRLPPASAGHSLRTPEATATASQTELVAEGAAQVQRLASVACPAAR